MVEHDLIGQRVLCLEHTPRTRFRVREDSFSSPKNELGFPGLICMHDEYTPTSSAASTFKMNSNSISDHFLW